MKEIVIIHESLLASWLKDSVALGLLVGGFYANHEYIQSGWLDATLCIVFFLSMFSRAIRGKSVKEVYSWAEAVKYCLAMENLPKGDSK